MYLGRKNAALSLRTDGISKLTTPFETADTLSALPAIKHGFFGRQGGGPEVMNISESFGPAGAVADSFAEACEAIGAPEARVQRLTQIHSAKVIVIDESSDLAQRPEADGMVTNQPGVALAIATADCAPVLFADPESGVIGACHAGWRGAVGGVIENTIDAMCALGAKREHISAAVGPTISVFNYEVGHEFATNLKATHPDADRFVFTPTGKAREHFDLPGFCAFQILKAGIAITTFAGGCTYGNPARYFSHRGATAGKSEPGRQAALIVKL